MFNIRFLCNVFINKVLTSWQYFKLLISYFYSRELPFCSSVYAQIRSYLSRCSYTLTSRVYACFSWPIKERMLKLYKANTQKLLFRFSKLRKYLLLLIACGKVCGFFKRCNNRFPACQKQFLGKLLFTLSRFLR